MPGKRDEAIGNTTTESDGRWQRATRAIAPSDPRDELAIDEIPLVLEAHGVASNGDHLFQKMDGRWQVTSLRDERAHAVGDDQGNDRATFDGRRRPQEVNTPGQRSR